MRRTLVLCTLLSALLFVSGCSSVAKAVFGIEEIKEFSAERVDSFFEYSHSLLSCSQWVATKEQQDSLLRLDLDSTMMQHRGQPVQILYFDGDSLIFYHISCYTQKGLFRADWNTYGSFDHFPPQPTVVPDPHAAMSLSSYARHLPGLGRNSRYTVVIIWSNILRRMSEKAVRAVADNIRNHDEVSVCLVNTDLWWVQYLNSQE